MMNLKKKAALLGAVLLLSLSMATSVFAETGTVTANVKLRSAASTESELVSGVNSGTTVEITGEENGWYKVTVNGMAGYISSEYVTKGAASSTQTTSTSEASDSSASQTTTAAGTENSVPVTVNGTEYYISQNFLETAIPSGFASGTVTINGTGYTGAVSESMGISLVYLYNDSDEGFFVYEEASGSFKKFVKVGNDSNYIILNSLPDGFEVPSGYTSSALSNDPSGTLSALTKDDAEASDLYYVYATNNEGNTGWYLYDAQLGSYIRASQPQAVASSQTTTDTSDISSDLAAVSSDASGASDGRIITYTHLIAILIGAIVLLLIVIINLLLWYRRGYKEELLDLEEEGYSSYGRGRRYEDEEEDFDEEDEEKEDEFLDEEEEEEPLPKRKSQSKPKTKAQAKPQPRKAAPKKRESKAELLEHDDDLDMDFLDLNDL